MLGEFDQVPWNNFVVPLANGLTEFIDAPEPES